MARERSKEINERKRHARWVNRRERFVMTTYKKMQEFDILGNYILDSLNKMRYIRRVKSNQAPPVGKERTK